MRPIDASTTPVRSSASTSRALMAATLLAAAVPGYGTARAATIAVETLDDNTNVDGACSLREAILNANSTTDLSGGDCETGDDNSGTDAIVFQVSGTSVLLNSLPPILQRVSINGFGTPADPTPDCPSGPVTMPVVLDGTDAQSIGLLVATSDSTIRGLAIQRFTQVGIVLAASDANRVQCSFVGTDHHGDGDRSERRHLGVLAGPGRREHAHADPDAHARRPDRDSDAGRGGRHRKPGIADAGGWTAGAPGRGGPAAETAAARLSSRNG